MKLEIILFLILLVLATYFLQRLRKILRAASGDIQNSLKKRQINLLTLGLQKNEKPDSPQVKELILEELPKPNEKEDIKSAAGELIVNMETQTKVNVEKTKGKTETNSKGKVEKTKGKAKLNTEAKPKQKESLENLNSKIGNKDNLGKKGKHSSETR